MTEWQPISTASKSHEDWHDILCYEALSADDGIYYVAAWDSTNGVWMRGNMAADDEDQQENEPTHWMPLPPPPVSK